MNQEATAYIVSLIDTNALWAWNQLHLATTLEALEQVAIDIGCDVFENDPYTKDEKAMKFFRQAYADQQQRIKNPDQEN